MIPLAVFGAVDDPLVTCVVIYFYIYVSKTTISVQVWYSEEKFYIFIFLVSFLSLYITQVLTFLFLSHYLFQK